MAYDTARERVVIFGGIGDSGYLADTWEWDGNNWVQRMPDTSPPARSGPAMAYDAARGRVVMFGGANRDASNQTRYLADTWEWDGSTWVQRTPAASPTARYGHVMAYDGVRGRVVLFGSGYFDGSWHFLADTWEWDGSTWARRTPATSPLARMSASMVYDSARERIVLFGGWGVSHHVEPNYSTNIFDDTWEWDGIAWVQRTPAPHPTVRQYPAMAYDSARGVTVFFGGDDSTVHGDLWEYGPLNHPPVADAGPDQVLECSGDGTATAALDGSASTDVDSTPRTHDDVVSFVWSENGTTLASGVAASVSLALGAHEVLLTATDKAGATATDGATITVQDTTPPVVTCPASMRVECQAAGQSPIALPPTTATDMCFGEIPITNDRTAGGADASGWYPLGSTTVTFTARDGAGNSATCQTVVTVVDTTPPSVTVESTPHYLWPPNHTMSPVHSRVVVHDACDPSPRVLLASVVSSEPDDAPGGGDGNTTNDIQGAALGTLDLDILLRAERDGNGPGRTYTIRYQALDASGNIGAGQDVVIVPHDQGGIGQDPITRQKRSARPGTRGGQPIAVAGIE